MNPQFCLVVHVTQSLSLSNASLVISNKYGTINE